MNKDIKDLEKLNPCKCGLEWFKEQSDLKTAWDNCQRGDWMLWYAQKVKVDKNKLVLCIALSVNLVRHLMKDERSIKAIDMLIETQEIDKEAYAAYADADAAYAAKEEILKKSADICRKFLTELIFR